MVQASYLSRCQISFRSAIVKVLTGSLQQVFQARHGSYCIFIDLDSILDIRVIPVLEGQVASADEMEVR